VEAGVRENITSDLIYIMLFGVDRIGQGHSNRFEFMGSGGKCNAIMTA
jgi:hypothetical protein